MRKSNAVVLEWLTSPIVYARDTAATEQLRAFADEALQPSALRHHYKRLAVRQWDTFISGRTEVARKKYLYALRPALTLMHLRLHNGVPPMSLPALDAGLPLDDDVREAIATFIAAKRLAKETGLGEREPLFDWIIRGEVEAATLMDTPSPSSKLLGKANSLFLQILR